MKTYGLTVKNYSTDVNDLAEMRRISQEILEATSGRRSVKRNLDSLNHSLTKTTAAGQRHFNAIVSEYYRYMAMRLSEAMDEAGDELPEHTMGNGAMEFEAQVREMAGQTIIRKNGYLEIAE